MLDLCIQSNNNGALPPLGYPIRKSTGQRVCAAHRSLSQLVASFIAFWHQGIHHVPFVAESFNSFPSSTTALRPQWWKSGSMLKVCNLSRTPVQELLLSFTTTYSLLGDTDYRQSYITTYLLPLYLSVCSCQRTRSVAGQPLREIVKWLLCSNPRTGTHWLIKY